MICPKCGQEASGNYCNNCGSPLYSEDAYYLDDPLDEEEEEFGPFFEEIDLFAEEEDSEPLFEEPAPLSYEEKESDWTELDLQSYKKPKEEVQAPFRYKAPAGQSKSKKKPKEKKPAVKKTEKKPEKKIEKKAAEIKQGREKRKEEPEIYPKRKRERALPEDNQQDSGFADKAVKGIKGVIVVCSRLMQWVSALLMVSMTGTMALSFWINREGLGSIQMIVTEENYGLALYLAFAGISLFFGLIWSLWILSRKAAGGGVRLKRYDTGRGFLPFLICAAAVFLAEPVRSSSLLPSVLYEWKGILDGAQAALGAITLHREQLLICSTLGAVLSLIRKILSV